MLDIHYDIQRGESFYNDRLPAVVERLLKSKIAEISEGAVCVFFRDIPELADKPAIIRKSDGGFNYATTDIATVDYRIQDLKADTVWLVVGAPQILHFKQIFEIARREGYTADFRHITFGSILGEDRKLMKTRSGENVALRDVLDEAIVRARKIVDEKNPDLPESGESDDRENDRHRRGEIRRSLAVSDDRLHFFLGPDAVVPGQHRALPAKRLRPHPIDLPESGRARALLVRQPPRRNSCSADARRERNLAKRLCQFAEIVPTVLNDFRPNVLANYLFELANSFHAFYEACPVLKSDEPARSSRLALCELTARVLASRPGLARHQGAGKE